MLEATRSLLVTGGLGAVTIAEVARRSETSNGSIYHRFGGRTGLLLAVQARSFDEINTETAEAFVRADRALTEGADRRKVAEALAATALDIFRRHHGAFRAFLVECRGVAELEQSTTTFLHALSAEVTAWLRDRLGAGPSGAEAAWRLLFSIGAASALVDDHRVSPATLSDDVFAGAVAAAVLAVIEPPRL